MKLTHIMIGLNYEEDMLSKEQFKTRHVITGHLGLDTCKSIVVANKTDNLQAVYLCHMGADSTDKDKCVAEIQKAAGNDVYVDCACKDKSWVLRSPDEPPF